jgi:hypothetical protein
MSTKNKKVTFDRSQYKKILALLNLDSELAIKIFFGKLDVIEFKDDASVYHSINYKVYDEDIETKWKQYRGIIIKDYTKIVCVGVGHTPTIALEGKLSNYLETDEKGDSYFKLLETMENGKREKHIIPVVPKRTRIRPAFQGSIIRIWLSNGIMYKSTLRNPYLGTAKWLGDPEEGEAKDFPTFSEKFDQICNYNRDVFFEKGVMNSPFCHIFIMVTPQVSSFCHIDCGEGFLMYLETKECYQPVSNDPLEEGESFFLSKIPAAERTTEEIQSGIEKQLDRFLFPLHRTTATYPMANFIPPPTTLESLRENSAVYRIGNGTLTLDEADRYLERGVSVNMDEEEVAKLRETFPNQMVYRSQDIRKLRKSFPNGLPGEMLYCTYTNDNGLTKTCLLAPQCSLYRAAMLKDPNSRKSQLASLRNFALTAPDTASGNRFIGVKNDLNNMRFEDLVYEQKTEEGSAYYLGIDNTSTDIVPLPPDYPHYLPTKKSYGMEAYSVDELNKSRTKSNMTERESYRNTKWFILALHYCLAMTPSRRKEAWNSFRKVYELYTQTLNFVCKHYEEILDIKSALYTNPANTAFGLAINSKYKTVSRMVEIIQKAKTAKYTVRIQDEPDELPDNGELPVTIRTGKEVTKTSYAEAFGLPGSEANPAAITRNIRNLLRKEEASSLYRIMKVVGKYMSRAK